MTPEGCILPPYSTHLHACLVLRLGYQFVGVVMFGLIDRCLALLGIETLIFVILSGLDLHNCSLLRMDSSKNKQPAEILHTQVKQTNAKLYCIS